MMKITGLSHLFKWENLHNWWLTKYFFTPLYITIQTAPFSHLEICPRVFTGSRVEEKVTHPLHSSQTSFEVLAPAYE